MRVLILPDVHHKVDRVKKILNQNNFDRIISLGDWFDDFNDTPAVAKKTAEFLLEMYDTYGDTFTWLLGNHDVPYVFPAMADQYWCSGYEPIKAVVINNVFIDNLDTSKPKLVEVLRPEGAKPIVLSHAGCHSYHFGDEKEVTTADKIEARCDEAIKRTRKSQSTPLLRAGLGRGGPLYVGGPTWLDWNSEFKANTDISQIVGHTPVRYPQFIDGNGQYIKLEKEKPYILNSNVSYNLNLDTHLNDYATLYMPHEGGVVLRVFEYNKDE